MRLSDWDLQQIDATFLRLLSWSSLLALIVMLVDDLKEARDRLNQNSRNSSRPPSSEPPWQGGGPSGEQAPDAQNPMGIQASEEALEEAAQGAGARAIGQAQGNEGAAGMEKETKRKGTAGRRRGMKGYGRQVLLPLSGEEVHRPQCCSECGQALEPSAFVASTALYVLDLVVKVSGLAGLELTHVKHIYGQIPCECGHVNCTEPGRCAAEAAWKVALSEWHLVGPTLASLIVCLSQRLRGSRRLIQEFLNDGFGVYVCTSTINQCLHEAGRAVAPVEDQLAAEINQAELVFADETTWKEGGVVLWLWVFCSATVTLFLVGARSKQIIENLLSDDFAGWLMSDGYHVYRQYLKRVRCWAHLVRKARGLAESLEQDCAQPFGEAALALLKELMKAVHQAREGPPLDLHRQYSEPLAQFKALCEHYRDCPHEKTRALAREFLNDWDVIWSVLKYPWLPLTNNEAERALRHWVIVRRICQGTRTKEGTRAFALLASVIETCRKRGISPWPYIAEVITQRRKGNPAPPLPATAA